MEINLDFDGTVVTHDFPNVGKDIGAVPILKKLIEKGHRLILFTMRSDIENPTSDDSFIHPKGGNYLTDAVNWFVKNEIPLYGIQTNPTQSTWTKSPKSYAPLMIDDSALGCPLKIDLKLSHKPFVDWQKVEILLKELNLI